MTIGTEQLDIGFDVPAAINEGDNVIELRANCAHDNHAAFAAATIAFGKNSNSDPGWYRLVICFTDPFWNCSAHGK